MNYRSAWVTHGWTFPTARAAGSKAREVETGQKRVVRDIYSKYIHMWTINSLKCLFSTSFETKGVLIFHTVFFFLHFII